MNNGSSSKIGASFLWSSFWTGPQTTKNCISQHTDRSHILTVDRSAMSMKQCWLPLSQKLTDNAGKGVLSFDYHSQTAAIFLFIHSIKFHYKIKIQKKQKLEN